MDLTPLIDVVFLLLIFFLLTSVSAKPMMPLNLPEAETSVAAEQATVVVAIKLDGNVYVNNEPVAIEALPATLENLFENNAKRELNLMSDKGVVFGRVVQVLDIAQKAGAENIAVVTENKTQ